MQTAEEFIGMCEREAYPAPSGVLINTLCVEALLERDAAVALAAKLEVLAEIREHVAAAYPYSGEWPRRYDALLKLLETKYADQAGGSNGNR